jgi:hypothetical protein
MGVKLSKLVVSDWPPGIWLRRQQRGEIKNDGPRWKDPAGQARLQDIVEASSDHALMLVVSDERGQEWANLIELADPRCKSAVSRSLSGALGRRVADVARINVAARSNSRRRG